MLDINNNNLVPSILALQFVAFGWRINREISVGDGGRKTWFPISDVINIFSMLCVVAFCIVVPLKSGNFDGISRVVLAVAFVLIAFHPICMAGHYRLFSKHGRYIYEMKGQDYPYATVPEVVFVVIAVLLAAVGAWYVA